jgi:phosphodiesterase/alkaline phosphatase D-like protein
VRRSTRRELVVGAAATALASAVPPAWARQRSRRVGIGPGSFRDGVASGEPSSSAVTLWSRLTTDHPRSGARLIVARDAGLDDVVAVTRVPTGRGVDGTLKARVGGLQPATEYYYAWESSNHVSPVGRTRTTAPRDSAQPLRIGFSSCQHYCYGYFSPHADAAAQDLDLYVFLGDYVYERGRVAGAPRQDKVEAVDLATYRLKYRRYRADPALRELHRLHPMVHIWDDHEVENNYTDENPRPAPAQRIAAYRAAFEWLPRVVMPSDRFRIYKQLPLGATADLFLLDTRQYRTGFDGSAERHIIDAPQLQWLIDGLKASTATWKVVAQQVVMANDPFGTGDTADQWDSAPADRARLLEELERSGLRNVLVLTGDAHVFMCNYLASDFQALGRDPARVPAAVEYVGGSVTSPGLVKAEAEVQAAEPWNVQYEGAAHGYAVMALDGAGAVTEYRRSDLSSPLGPTIAFERFTQPSGVNRVTRERLAPPASV